MGRTCVFAWESFRCDTTPCRSLDIQQAGVDVHLAGLVRETGGIVRGEVGVGARAVLYIDADTTSGHLT